jgi:predicted transposase YbfD/YdcC
MFVKENQPTLQTDIQSLLERAHLASLSLGPQSAPHPSTLLSRQRVQVIGDAGGLPHLSTAHTSNVGHGRIEWRQLQALSVPAHGAHLDWLEWPGRAQVFVVERRTTSKKRGKSGRQRQEKVYGITSLSAAQASPQRLLELCRGHWGIENRSHWVRDVTFDEDRSTVRSGSLPQIMAALRNTVMGLMRLAGKTNIAAACRRHAAQPQETLNLLGITPTFELPWV